VDFELSGFYSTSLSLPITGVARFPVREVVLFKLAPSDGMYAIGPDGYVPVAKSKLESEWLDHQTFAPNQVGNETVYRVGGQPTKLTMAQAKSIIDNSQKSLRLMRVKRNGEFLRKLVYGLGIDIKLQGDAVENEKTESKGKFTIRMNELPPGLYVFAAGLSSTVVPAIGHPVSDPCFFFEVLSSEASERAAAKQRLANANTPAGFAEIVNQIPEASQFEKFSREYRSNYDAVWQAVQASLTNTKETPQTQDKEKGIIVTDYTGHGPFKRSFYKYVVCVERKSDGESKVTCMLLQKYFNTLKQEEVYLTGRRNQSDVESLFDAVAKRLNQK
jgi:hypothetical protein